MAKKPTDTIEIEDEFSQYQLPDDPEIPPSNIQPSANGSVLGNGDFSSPNFVAGQVGWRMDSEGNFEAVNATFSGAISGLSLNIPDATTTNSFHVDSSGNVWWGANVASGYTNATAYILNTGFAHFENIEIGGTTVQYVITNSGIFSFGDGSDGVGTFDGSGAVTGASKSGSTYTLTRDVYYTTATVSDGVTVDCAGYRIFCSQSLVVGGGTSGVIHRNGSTGAAGAAFNVGGSATTLATGYLYGSGASGAGGGGGGVNTVGNPGGASAATSNSLNAAVGGAGGHGGDSTKVGGVGGSSTLPTVSNVKLIANWHLATLLDIAASGSTVKFTTSGSGGGGGEGGGNASGFGAAGGGAGGTSGGLCAIYAKSITINSGALISANGGTGGQGGDPNGGATGVGGGGGGGAGGIVVLVYNSLTNNGSITASGGTGGARGSGINGSTTNATAGSSGSAGTIYQFQLSL